MAQTIQKPIHSGFEAASTAEDVIKGIDLTGKVAIVTGGYSGLGLVTARTLKKAGAKVIVPARDIKKASQKISSTENIIIEPLDLANPASIDAFAERFLSTEQPLHILINSAGIMATPLIRDLRGFEAQFATNHLGHFQLTARLWPALVRADGARVVAVSSRGHRFSDVHFEDPNFEDRDYNPMAAYGQSKTANILFALHLDRLGQEQKVRAFSVHPGTIVDTDLGRHMSMSEEMMKSAGLMDAQGNIVLNPLRQQKTVEQGASTSVWCATSPKLDGLGGVYCENNDISNVVYGTGGAASLDVADERGSFGVLSYAVNPEAAERLWKLSEKLTDVKFINK